MAAGRERRGNLKNRFFFYLGDTGLDVGLLEMRSGLKESIERRKKRRRALNLISWGPCSIRLTRLIETLPSRRRRFSRAGLGWAGSVKGDTRRFFFTLVGHPRRTFSFFFFVFIKEEGRRSMEEKGERRKERGECCNEWANNKSII